jgi:hypothetical protein
VGGGGVGGLKPRGRPRGARSHRITPASGSRGRSVGSIVIKRPRGGGRGSGGNESDVGVVGGWRGGRWGWGWGWEVIKTTAPRLQPRRSPSSRVTTKEDRKGRPGAKGRLDLPVDGRLVVDDTLPGSHQRVLILGQVNGHLCSASRVRPYHIIRAEESSASRRLLDAAEDADEVDEVEVEVEVEVDSGGSRGHWTGWTCHTGLRHNPRECGEYVNAQLLPTCSTLLTSPRRDLEINSRPDESLFPSYFLSSLFHGSIPSPFFVPRVLELRFSTI